MPRIRSKGMPEKPNAEDIKYLLPAKYGKRLVAIDQQIQHCERERETKKENYEGNLPAPNAKKT